MPQHRKNSKEDTNAINPSFPPPSLINSPLSDGNDKERRKKKEKKWSLGGLFRRKKNKDSDTDTSSPTEEEEKKGFLERRRSARKKRNRGSKDVTGSFEHIVVNRNSGDVQSVLKDNVTVKDGGERLKSSHESLNKRLDTSQLHGSVASLEGSMRRSGRMKVMARVEANRDRLRADSSSDEGGSSRSRQSISSTQQFRSDENLGSKEGSLSRKSRTARTERYIKRLSKDEEGVKDVELPKVSKSEERLVSKSGDVKIASGNRWTAKIVYYESSDYETKYTAKTKSATPSPIQSPKARTKNILHQTTSAPPASLYTTFPPSHSREGVVGSHQELRSNSFQGGAFQRVTPKSMSMQKVNELLPKIPKSKSDVSHRAFQNGAFPKQSWEQKLPGTKSASFDSSINMVTRAHPSDSNVLVVQFPISRPQENNRSAPPPPPRDPQRRIVLSNSFQDSSQRPMSYAFEIKTHPQMKVNSDLRLIQPKSTALPINRHQRSNSDQQLSSQVVHIPKQSPPTQRRQSYMSGSKSDWLETELLEQQSKVPQHYQYYTDQHPRSRRPIHISYTSPQHDQPYLSDSQVVVKAPHLQPGSRTRPVAVQNASDFWKQKEQETSRKMHMSNNSPKVLQKHFNSGFVNKDNSGSRLNLPPIIMPIMRNESTSSLSGQSDVSSPRIGHKFKISHNEVGIPLVDDKCYSDNYKKDKDVRPLSMVLEKSELSEQEGNRKRDKSTPPTPPVRRHSRQNSGTAGDKTDVSDIDQSKRKSSNLEEALNELEAIYKSLRLGEEDQLEKVEKREQLAYPERLDPKNWNAWVQSRGFESDSSFNYSRSSIDSMDSPHRVPGRSAERPCEPDRVADDMAYRKLNKKDRPIPQEYDVISQAGSFLLVSPTLSPPPFAEEPPIPVVKDEPDVTLDDVVYRNIKHVNNTLKVLDPQPPFGIPLGPISPAPNSDYLHITPKERYKATFKPRKTPDVVTDDLAFRNLRKDNSKEASLYNSEDNNALVDVPNFKKKRAIRSLSANLLGIIQKESYSMTLNNNNSLVKNNNENNEKSLSITNLNHLNLPQNLRDNKENMNASNTKGFRKYKYFSEDESDGTKRNSKTLLADGFLLGMNTSTETLTDSRVNLHESKTKNLKQSWLNRQSEKHNLPPSSGSRTSVTPEKSQPRKEATLSQFSPSTTSSVFHFQKHSSPHSITPDIKQEEYNSAFENKSSINQTESELLAVLAREARATSEQLGRELKELHGKQEKNLNKGQNDYARNIDQSGKSTTSIGKIVHHKPVKLNTFSISEELQSNKKSTDSKFSPEASKSMTDLLKELTRSLDNDFATKTKTPRSIVKGDDSLHKIKRTKNIDETSEDSNSECINTICQSASSLTALSNSPLRGLSPIRRSKENITGSPENKQRSLERTASEIIIKSPENIRKSTENTSATVLDTKFSESESLGSGNFKMLKESTIKLCENQLKSTETLNELPESFTDAVTTTQKNKPITSENTIKSTGSLTQSPENRLTSSDMTINKFSEENKGLTEKIKKSSVNHNSSSKNITISAKNTKFTNLDSKLTNNENISQKKIESSKGSVTKQPENQLISSEVIKKLSEDITPTDMVTKLQESNPIENENVIKSTEITIKSPKTISKSSKNEILLDKATNLLENKQMKRNKHSGMLEVVSKTEINKPQLSNDFFKDSESLKKASEIIKSSEDNPKSPEKHDTDKHSEHCNNPHKSSETFLTSSVKSDSLGNIEEKVPNNDNNSVDFSASENKTTNREIKKPRLKDITFESDTSSQSTPIAEQGTCSTTVTDEGIKPLMDASTLLLVCSYCMACVHQLAGLDVLTILGIFLAMASVILFWIC